MSDTPIYDQLVTETLDRISAVTEPVPTRRDRWVAFWSSITPEEARARREEYRRG
jgi:hypothetical protein